MSENKCVLGIRAGRSASFVFSLVAMLLVSPFPVMAANPRVLRGFTVGDLSEETLRDAAQIWHANIVRVWLTPKRWSASGDDWNAVLAKLPAGLDRAASHGIVVVLTLNQMDLCPEKPGVKVSDGSPRFWKEPQCQEALLEIWAKLATLLSARKQEIWLDVLNEPVDPAVRPKPPLGWPDLAQRVIDRIRAVDRQHKIVIECGPFGLCSGFATMPYLRGDGLIYSCHQYEPHRYTHQGVRPEEEKVDPLAFLNPDLEWPGYFAGRYWDRSRIEKELEPVAAFQRGRPGIEVYIGEFSGIRWAKNVAGYLTDNIALFEEHHWSWTYHAFREWSGWSPEFSSDRAATSKSSTLTDRGAVLLQALQKNEGVSAKNAPSP